MGQSSRQLLAVGGISRTVKINSGNGDRWELHGRGPNFHSQHPSDITADEIIAAGFSASSSEDTRYHGMGKIYNGSWGSTTQVDGGTDSSTNYSSGTLRIGAINCSNYFVATFARENGAGILEIGANYYNSGWSGESLIALTSDTPDWCPQTPIRRR